MVSNVSAHSITYRRLIGRGMLAGLASAVVAALISMFVGPLVAVDTDVWTFPKVVASIVLGESAANPLTGFQAGIVFLGLALHLLIGAIFGGVFAFLVGLMDVGETVPIMLAGMVFGAVVFLTSYVLIAQLAFPAFQDLPLVVAFWNHVAFGIVSGIMLGRWHERYDLGHHGDTAPGFAVERPETVAFYGVAALVLVVGALMMFV